MKNLIRISALTLALSAASVAYAQINPANAAQSDLALLLLWVINFIDKVLVPFVFTLALLLFLWGVYSAFIAGGMNEEKREEGKKFILWGIIGMFVMVSVWGLVNILTGTFQLNNTKPCLPTFSGQPCAASSNPQQNQVQTSGDCPTGTTAYPSGAGFTCI